MSPRPSGAGGFSRANGFEASSRKAWKPSASVPPRSGDLVDERLRAVAVRSDQQDGEVGSRKDDEEHREGEKAQQSLNDGQPTDRPIRFELAANVQDAEE